MAFPQLPTDTPLKFATLAGLYLLGVAAYLEDGSWQVLLEANDGLRERQAEFQLEASAHDPETLITRIFAGEIAPVERFYRISPDGRDTVDTPTELIVALQRLDPAITNDVTEVYLTEVVGLQRAQLTEQAMESGRSAVRGHLLAILDSLDANSALLTRLEARFDDRAKVDQIRAGYLSRRVTVIDRLNTAGAAAASVGFLLWCAVSYLPALRPAERR